MGSTEPLWQGRRARPRRECRGFRGQVKAPRHDPHAPLGGLDPVEGTRRNHIREDLSEDHHREEDDQRVRDLELAFPHDAS